MYSTVIDRHPTVIRHQIPQPTIVGVKSEVGKAFAIKSETNFSNINLPNEYSTQIKYQSQAINDPKLSGYDSPNFIHKKENIFNQNEANTQKEVIISNTEVFLNMNMQEDINSVISQLENNKDKQAKISICKLDSLNNFFLNKN